MLVQVLHPPPLYSLSVGKIDASSTHHQMNKGKIDNQPSMKEVGRDSFWCDEPISLITTDQDSTKSNAPINVKNYKYTTINHHHVDYRERDMVVMGMWFEFAKR